MIKRASIALIPLLLLPNFLFLIPLEAVAAGISAPPGQPLPPGTAVAHNSWDLNQSCPSLATTPEPLQTMVSWTAKLAIPLLLFDGRPDGSLTTQTFTVSQNGALSASDDQGNSFTLSVPSPLVGSTTTTLVGNSTRAVVETTVSASALEASSDIKLIFSIYDEFCHAAGVKLEISGTAEWPKGSGTISIAFGSRPSFPTAPGPGNTTVSSPGYVASFGDSSGVGLGFDWSDSKSLSPSYNTITNTVDYHVGNTFEIDPKTVATSTTNQATKTDFSGLTCNANGRYWVFFNDGTHQGWSSSIDGITWSAETTITTSGNPGLSFFCKGATVSYTTGATSNGASIYYDSGTMNTGGTISWGTEGHFSTSGSTIRGVSTAIDSNGYWWVAFGSFVSSSGEVEVWRCTTPTSCSWSQSTSFAFGGSYAPYVKITALTSGKVSIVYNAGSNTVGSLNVKTFSGSAWSSSATTSGSTYGLAQGSCVAISDTTECAMYDNNVQVGYITASYNGNSPTWSSETVVASSCSAPYAGISTDGGIRLAVAYVCNGGSSVSYVKSLNAGSSWTSPYLLSSSQTSPVWLAMSYSFTSSGYFYAAWTTGSSSYNVNFVSIPSMIPVADPGANSWGRPGLSPYESYFNSLVDYFSPGNGLLSVELGTFDLPGRGGLDFAPTLVYGEPYSFRSSGSPYLYENYTGASLGYGWALNFPWLGSNYLHLADGQEFPYVWSNNIFQVNGAENFMLTSNTGGTYTLTMPSGSVYQFDSSKRLTSVTDRTGNNAIAFSYGTNGYISQASDPTGRQTTFSYNGNNELTGIAEGGRTWTIAYGQNGFGASQLTTVTDPLSRVTTFKYAGTTGANAWLLNEIDFPTQGKITHSYKNINVGTELTGNLVSSKTVYYDSTHISLSQSTNYTLVNGLVIWAHTKESNGTKVQDYQHFNFQTSPKATTNFIVSNPTNQTIKTTETDYDTSGRINRTAITSSSSYGIGAYWPLDDGKGTSVADISSNGNTGTLTSSSNWLTSGCKYADCYNFNNVYMTAPDSSTLDSGKFTVSFWLNPSISFSGYQRVVSKDSYVTGAHSGWLAIFAGTGNQLYLALFNTAHTEYDSPHTPNIPTSSWSLITFTFDGTNICAYYNGASEGCNAISGTYLGSTNPLVVAGGDGNAPSNGYANNIYVDDLRYYDLAISSSQASAMDTATGGAGAGTATSISSYDNWGNVIYTKDALGQQTWFSYYNTNSQNSFGTSGCTASFFSQTISPSIEDLPVGRCDYQNGAGTPQQETFFQYDSVGNLLEQRTSHSGGWIYTNYFYDSYGNIVMATQPSTTPKTNACFTGSPFGSGSDGSATISSDTTLTANKNYKNLTVNSGVHLYPNGYSVHVCGNLINNGFISGDGSQGSTGSTGSTGGSGSNGVTGGANDGGTHNCPTNGGGHSGTNAGSGAGGGGGAWACDQNGGSLTAGSGGSPGGNGAAGGPGGTGSGGGNAGSVTVYAFVIDNLGTISANGGSGGRGGTGGTGGAGGAGGNGQAGTVLVNCGQNAGCAAGGGGGGNSGNGGTGGSGGTGGTGGSGGSITLYYSVAAETGLGVITANPGGGGPSGTGGSGGSSVAGGTGGSGNSVSGICPAESGGTGNGGGSGGSTDTSCNANSGSNGASGNTGGQGSAGNSGSSGSAGSVAMTRTVVANFTYFTYSSTYTHAYLTKQSILVGSQNVTSTYTYNSTMGFLMTQTDPNAQTTSYKYDVLGRQTQVTFPATGGTSSIRKTYYYDGNDTMKVVDENNHVTKYAFDGLARVIQVQRWNGTSAYSTESYTYNWLNLVATHTMPSGSSYTYAYDPFGRETKATNPDSPATYTTTSYDDANNLKTFTDERGHQTVYAYDWNERLTSVVQYNSTSNAFLTSYSYDLSGNMLSVTDAKSQTTSYQYDDLNRLVTTTFPTSPSTSETRTYDSVGNLLTRTTANGSQISYAYDGLNRLVKVTYPGSGGTVTYSYDSDSNRASMVNPSAKDYYSYDARDRLTNQTQYVGGVKYMTVYTYDGVGNVLSIKYPDAVLLSMTYDAVNRLKTDGSYATVSYTVDDKVSKIIFGNGEVTYYTYDSRDRPTQIDDKYQGTKEMDLNYTYDGTGNAATLNTETYHYDWLNRLNYSSGPWTTITYAYDQVGNRIRMVQGTTTTYAYGSFNRLSSAGSTTYTYDANGNMITKTGGWTYSYDYENRLTKVSLSGTTKQTNSYDGDGSRVQQVAGSSTFTYAYQGLNILYEKNVTGGTTTVTKHFYANELQVAKMVGSTVYYMHQDALGSTRLVATASVTIKFSSNYVPYGNNYAISGKEVFMYTGKQQDSATGLYYYGARYYDSTIGRFVTQDSYHGDRSDPMTLNLYTYARDNPEKYLDPTGHKVGWALGTDFVAADGGILGCNTRACTTDFVAAGPGPTMMSTPTTLTLGGPVGLSSDITLARLGVDQYATPTIGLSGGPTSGSLLINPVIKFVLPPPPPGAVQVAVGIGEAGVGYGIIAVGAYEYLASGAGVALGFESPEAGFAASVEGFHAMEIGGEAASKGYSNQWTGGVALGQAFGSFLSSLGL